MFLLLLVSCEKEDNVLFQDGVSIDVPVSTTMPLKAEIFRDWEEVSTIPIVEFKELAEPYLEQGESPLWKASFEVAAHAPEDFSKSGNSKVLMVPVVEGNGFSDVVIFDVTGESPDFLGTIDLTDYQNTYMLMYVIAKTHENPEEVLPYHIDTDGFYLDIGEEDEASGGDKGCRVITSYSRNCVRLGPNGEYGTGLDCIDISTHYIHCTIDAVYVPTNVTITRGGGGGNPLNYVLDNNNRNIDLSKPIDLNLFPADFQHILCSTWNMGHASRSYGQAAFTTFDGGVISIVQAPTPLNPNGVNRTLDYHVFFQVPLPAGVSHNSSEFTRCMNRTFTTMEVAVEQAFSIPFMGNPSDETVLRDIQLQLGRIAGRLGQCFGGDQNNFRIDVYPGHLQPGHGNQYVSGAHYGSYYDYLRSCYWD